MASKRACEATAKILEGVEITLADTISGSALHCADELRAQGWQGGGESYDLGAYPGDREDLEKLLSRKATRDERALLERCIKAELDVRCEVCGRMGHAALGLGYQAVCPVTAPRGVRGLEARGLTMANRLARIRFTRGRTGDGFQETDADGVVLRLYDAKGGQFDPGNVAWEFVRDLGEIDPDDAATFWEALERDGVEIVCP